MQPKVQKSTSTTLPRNEASVSGRELSQWVMLVRSGTWRRASASLTGDAALSVARTGTDTPIMPTVARTRPVKAAAPSA